MHKNSLILSVLLVATSAHAHGPDREQTAAAGEPFDPVYLRAAVCSLHGQRDPSAFERRVELIKLARAQTPASMQDDGPPLYDNRGDYSYRVTTDSDRAQRYFDQGLRLAYAFNHYEALRAFREAQKLDPDCAMCYWGEAWVLGPNINAPMEPAAMKPAVAAVEKARARTEAATPRERALINALVERYSTDRHADQAVLNRAYAKAMSEVASRFVDDVDIAAMYAGALMNLSPWDYWEADGKTLKEPVADLVKTLENALAKAPSHPYAIHLYLHTMEASKTPERAEAYADRLPEQMPGAGHLVHMPFHIYFNIGRFSDGVTVNRDAVAADEAYLARAQDNELYAYGYYPHNLHSLLESARMAGDAEAVIEAAEKLPTIMSEDMAAAVPWVRLMYAAPYFAHAQFSDPETTLALAKPSERFPYVKATWHYARGVAQAARGDIEAARREARAIADIEHNADLSGLTGGGVPALELMRLARRVVDARIAQAGENYDAAVAELEKAVAIQDALPYLEPPFWYYPTRQSLGAALLQAGRAGEAQRVLRASLEKTPHNGWALYGLMRAQRARGDRDGAASSRARLDEVWAGSRAALTLGRL